MNKIYIRKQNSNIYGFLGDEVESRGLSPPAREILSGINPTRFHKYYNLAIHPSHIQERWRKEFRLPGAYHTGSTNILNTSPTKRKQTTLANVPYPEPWWRGSAALLKKYEHDSSTSKTKNEDSKACSWTGPTVVPSLRLTSSCRRSMKAELEGEEKNLRI